MKVAIIQNDEVKGVLDLEAVPRKGDFIRDKNGMEHKVVRVVWQQGLFVGEDELSSVKAAAKVIVKSI